MKRNKIVKRARRKVAIRIKVSGTSERPRLFLSKSNRYMRIGVADDRSQKVLFSITGEKGVKNAKELGAEIAKKLIDKKIEAVVFDRSGYKYHGQVAAVAEGLRESGIKV